MDCGVSRRQWTSNIWVTHLWQCHFWIILLGLFAVASAEFDKDSSFKGPFKVLRITPQDDTQFAMLVSLWRNSSDFDLDFWHGPTRLHAPVDIMVSPLKDEIFQNYLNQHKFHYLVTIPDVQKLIDIKQSNINQLKIGNFSRRFKDTRQFGGGFSIAKYHSYAEIQQYMADLQTRFPTRCTVFTIGHTHERRPIQLMKIGSPSLDEATSPKRAFWIDGGIHAREWIAPSTALYFIHQLATNYDTDVITKQYVDNIDWYILPVANPDGYEFSRSSTFPKVRLWRKNRSPISCRPGTSNCCQGVDLNRNFDFHWGETGSSHDPCDEVYAGSSAFSEPETKAVRDFIAQRPNRFDGFVTLHSYSQIWMYPYGHRMGHYPADVNDLKNVAVLAKRALQSNFGTKYIVGTGADTLYPATGGSDDWAKESANIKYVYLLELRPEEHIWDGFILDESLIVPTGKETWDGIKIVADAILQWNDIKPLNRLPPAVAPRPLNTPPCVDGDKQCRFWASFGGCRTWPELGKRCAKSCRACDPDSSETISYISPYCFDQIYNCQEWVELNLCSWVAEMCQSTCGFC